MPIGTQEFEYHLGGDFFVNMESLDIHGADLDVKLLVTHKSDVYDLEFEIIHARSASNCVDWNGEEFGYLKKCLNECYPEAGVIPYLMTGGTDCRHYEEIADNCLRFCPIKMSNEQLAAMHAANESIGVTETAHCVKFYKHYIKNHK